MVYPTQYSKIVIEVKYCACPTSELNEWVIFVGKKSNYRLSQNCLRDRRTMGMFFFSTFLLLSHVILPVSPVPLSPSPSFYGLPSVPFLQCYTLLCFIPVRITFSCTSFLSSTFFSFLPLYYHSVRPSYVSFSFDCFIFFLYLLIFHVINVI
jgi:hypothetical protein